MEQSYPVYVALVDTSSESYRLECLARYRVASAPSSGPFASWAISPNTPDQEQLDAQLHARIRRTIASHVAERSDCNGGGAAEPAPPSSNTGGNYDKKQSVLDYKSDKSVGIDTLSFTVKLAGIVQKVRDWSQFGLGGFHDEDALTVLNYRLSRATGLEFVSYSGAGRNGYVKSMKLAYTDKRLKHDLGFIAWGGNNGTAQIYLTGECCTYLNSLGLMGTEIYPLMVEYEAKITRADLAYDDFTGSIPIEDVYDYWRCGHFTFTRTPTYEQVGTDWFNPTKKGRSCYVGNAKNGKVLNVYEKGRQLGDRDSPWVRWELRLGNKDRIIPLEVALNPGSFFKGAYPMFNSFIDLTPALAIKTLKKKVSITINDSIRVIKNQFGKYINVLRNLYGDSHLLKEILIEDVPKRLIFPSPVLSVDLSEGFDLFHHDLETDETFYA